MPRKKIEETSPPPSLTITHCNFTVEAVRLESIEALARAAEANAKAIQSIAEKFCPKVENMVKFSKDYFNA